MNFIDYSQPNIHFMGKRKHFFKDVLYHVYIFEDFLVMGLLINDPKPKYRITYSLQIQIQFLLDRNWSKDIKIIAFLFKYRNLYKEIYADHVDILKMKNKISNKVTFYKIADFYDPQSVIGKGSSARVLLVKKLFDPEQFAVKSIDKSYLFKSDTGLEAFQSEVKILTLLSHTNTDKQKLFLKLYEIFEGDLTYYLIVELMKGNTLQDELDALKSSKDGQSMMTPVQTLIIMQKLLEGVSIMHLNNIIHRDLKPDNIMFAIANEYHSLRIVDFGLATETSVEKYMFPKCGTPGYVAPEVLNLSNRTEKYSPICDLFSCGCIFFKLLTGRSLFQGTQFNEVLKLNKACDIDLTNNQELQNVSPDALNLLTQLLQKDPKKRITADDALKHPYLQYQKTLGSTQGTSSTKISTNEKPDTSRSQSKSQKKSNVNEDAFSPFQKRAMGLNSQQIKLQNVQEENKGEEESLKEENLSDKVMQEFKHHEGLSIQVLPTLKRPGNGLSNSLRIESDVQDNQLRSKSAQLAGNDDLNIDKFQELDNEDKLASLGLNKMNSIGAYRQSLNQTSVNSFYMKQPLSSLKKHKYKKDSKKDTYMFQSQDGPPEDLLQSQKVQDPQLMEKVSLFNRANPSKNSEK